MYAPQETIKQKQRTKTRPSSMMTTTMMEELLYNDSHISKACTGAVLINEEMGSWSQDTLRDAFKK